MSRMKHVIVIGAGITGLTAAFRLVQRGIAVTVVEASNCVGGLAGSLMSEDGPVEKYYHFICRGDDDLIDLVAELGLSEALHWREAKTSFYIEDKLHPFVSPADLLRFDPVPLSQRLRFGFHVLASQHRKDWHGLDKIAAKDWLIRHVGKEAYVAIWDPLLRIKFGPFHEQISAAWIWHRIHRVARSRDGTFKGNTYGFLDRGCSILIDALLMRLRASDSFRLLTGHTVKNIESDGSSAVGVRFDPYGELLEADAVISTAAIPSFIEIAPPMADYSARLSGIEYLNIVCVLFELDRPFTDSFWLNVNDPSIAFNGIVELTNLSPRTDLGSSSFVYIPFYVHKDDPRWTYTDQQLYDEYTSAMELIRKDFDRSWIRRWWVSRDLNAQAICRIGFLDIMPAHETPVRGLYITDSSQYYPEDRTVSASIRLARQVAELVLRSLPT